MAPIVPGDAPRFLGGDDDRGGGTDDDAMAAVLALFQDDAEPAIGTDVDRVPRYSYARYLLAVLVAGVILLGVAGFVLASPLRSLVLDRADSHPATISESPDLTVSDAYVVTEEQVTPCPLAR
jgi:hypothetical protein